MLIHATTSCRVLAILLLMGLPAVAHSRDLYRYYNEDGHMVVDYQVPAEYVGRGYEVLNTKGVVIKVVPRELTEEERQVADAQQILDARAAEEEERLRKWDESLLLRYSTIEDIEALRERNLRNLRIRVSILKSNRRGLKHKVENYQSQAADIERRGEEVDLVQLRAIEDTQAEISTTERAIIDREREIKEVADAFQMDIDRFAMLLEVVAFRRTLLEQDRENRKTQAEDPRR
jgi:hypothetical protein